MRSNRRFSSRSSPPGRTATRLSCAYDRAGNLPSSTYANAATTTRTYDALNRLLTAHAARGGFSSEDVVYTYDDATPGHFGLGRLAGFTDPSGSTSLAYERRGMVASRVQTIAGTAYPLSFLYDGNGNRTSMSYPSTRVVTTAFDFADRPVSASSGGTTYVTGALYAPFGPLTALTYGTTPPLQRAMAYDQRYLPQSLLVTGASEVISYTYGTDAGGNLTAITDQGNGGYSRSFSYDDLNRLTTADTGASLWGVGNHAYDPMGNLTGMQLGATLRSFTYQGLRAKLASVDENGTVRAVSYDPAGNESVQGASYLYSPRNLLASVSGVVGAIVRAPLGHLPIHRASPDPLTVYTYDGRGIRVKLAQSDGGPSQERSFLYDEAMHLVAETTYQAPPSTAIAYEYVWFGGQPVAQETILGSTAWTITDHLGTPFLQTSSTGTVIWRVEYEPYGEVYALRSGTDRHQPLRLPGQEAEQLDLGLNGDSERSYNIFRWYRPKWGRYTQADPILLSWTTTYGYALGDPIDISDPTGRQPNLGLTDEKCLVCTVFAEARGTPAACQQGAASVILNRVDWESKHGGQSTVCGVVFASILGPFYGASWEKNRNFKECADCFFPKTEPELAQTVRNLAPGFPRNPPALYFGNNTPDIVRKFRAKGKQPVPFPQCGVFAFFGN